MKVAFFLLAFVAAERFSGGEVRAVSWRAAQQQAFAANAKIGGWLSFLDVR